MKVYVILERYWDSTELIGVYLDKEDAEKVAKENPLYDIEEAELK